jgi:hypothetical protein
VDESGDEGDVDVNFDQGYCSYEVVGAHSERIGYQVKGAL